MGAKSALPANNAQELIVVVNPVVLRETVAKSGMWAYPPVSELLGPQTARRHCGSHPSTTTMSPIEETARAFMASAYSGES